MDNDAIHTRLDAYGGKTSRAPVPDVIWELYCTICATTTEIARHPPGDIYPEVKIPEGWIFPKTTHSTRTICPACVERIKPLILPEDTDEQPADTN